LADSRGMDWRFNLGLVILGMVLLISIVAVLTFLVVPMVFEGRGSEPRVLPLSYFIAVGLGYILVEITLIQRFVLFLGHPTYALTVVVFSLLLSSGAGSVMARRWIADAQKLRMVLIAVVAFIVLNVLVLTSLL